MRFITFFISLAFYIIDLFDNINFISLFNVVIINLFVF